MRLHFQDTFRTELPSDSNTTNDRRQVFEATHSYVTPRIPSTPQLIHVSDEVLDILCLSRKDSESKAFLDVFTGGKVPEGARPYAMAYAGHQFGNWAGQLGDGRAINLGEIVHNESRWALQLKGAGETPYSRTADGLAVLRSSIREHLCSEAMYHLGVPTTRSLSLALTGDEVLRDILYDGHPEYEKGAVVCRVAPSFIRFGNFELFASRKDVTTLRQLTNYTIRHFYPHLKPDSKSDVVKFFREVAEKTMSMVMHWQRVGFVHGVMNTDNMSILGLTIDYGPYGWLEGYDVNWTPNTTDRQNRRYRYGFQPYIALWNLTQLANALYPLVEEIPPLQEVIEHYQNQLEVFELTMMRKKLGLQIHQEDDKALIQSLQESLQLSETDMTIFFRELASINANTTLPENFFDLPISKAYYQPNEINSAILASWKAWLNKYIQRLQLETMPEHLRIDKMHNTNPKYVLRNYMAQLAIDATKKADYSLIEELYQLLKTPYAEHTNHEKWYAKRPEWARHKVGCSMLSCSS
ncbi:MAG: YdiU family protein [Saprospiraceae bacterium]|nr:YdiU family protein [Saprospiraceae bacterium]